MTSVSGLRLFFLLGDPSEIAVRAVTRLVDGLRARGAAVEHSLVEQSEAAQLRLRDAVQRFAPSTLVSAWSAFGAELAATSGLPVIHLARASSSPPSVLGESPRGVVLWLDASGTESATLACPVPSVALGSLEGESGEGALDLIAELLVETRDIHRSSVSTRTPEGPHAIGRDDLVDYLHASAPDGLHTRVDVEAFVDQGIALGMPSWGDELRPIFDKSRSVEWLFRKSAAFRAEIAAHRRTRELGGVTPDAPRLDATSTRSCRVTASISADLGELEEGTKYRVYLPLPIEAPSQPSVRLVSVSPAALVDALVAKQGFFYGWEGRVGVDQAFAARCVADVCVLESSDDVLDEVRSAPPARSFAELRDRASRVPSNPLELAWSVYAWMMQVGRFGRPSAGCRCGKCAAAHFQRETSGDCIVLSHAFVHFCGELGVRARPVRGALFGAPRGTSGRCFGVRKAGEPIIGHTWAEIETPGLGWLPVEFDPICLKNVEPALCWDDGLRERVRQDHAYLLRRSFGNVDHQRILYSTSVMDISPILYFDTSRPRGQRWRPLDLTKIRFEHEVEYLEGASSQ